jgi:hypothetical protein
MGDHSPPYCVDCVVDGCDECWENTHVRVLYCHKHNEEFLRVCDECQDAALCETHRIALPEGREGAVLCPDCREDVGNSSDGM